MDDSGGKGKKDEVTTPDVKMREYERELLMQRIVVLGVAVATLGFGVAAAYWLWPAGITDLTLASISFGALLRAITSGVIVLVSLVIAALLWMD